MARVNTSQAGVRKSLRVRKTAVQMEIVSKGDQLALYLVTSSQRVLLEGLDPEVHIKHNFVCKDLLFGEVQVSTFKTPGNRFVCKYEGQTYFFTKKALQDGVRREKRKIKSK